MPPWRLPSSFLWVYFLGLSLSIYISIYAIGNQPFAREDHTIVYMIDPSNSNIYLIISFLTWCSPNNLSVLTFCLHSLWHFASSFSWIYPALWYLFPHLLRPSNVRQMLEMTITYMARCFHDINGLSFYFHNLCDGSISYMIQSRYSATPPKILIYDLKS